MSAKACRKRKAPHTPEEAPAPPPAASEAPTNDDATMVIVQAAALVCDEMAVPLHAAAENIGRYTAIMVDRCAASVDTLGPGLRELFHRVDLAGRGAVSGLRGRVSAAVKAVDSCVDAVLTTADQLVLCAAVLESMSVDDLDSTVVVLVRALLARVPESQNAPSMVYSSDPSALDREALNGCVYVREGITLSTCNAAGPGLDGFLCGDGDHARANNRIDVWLRDGAGEAISGPDIASCVSATGNAGVVWAVEAGADGQVVVSCSSPVDTAVHALQLTLSLFGAPLSPEPWRIPVCARMHTQAVCRPVRCVVIVCGVSCVVGAPQRAACSDSDILSGLDSSLRMEFSTVLGREWIPSCRPGDLPPVGSMMTVGPLLYRFTRDQKSPATYARTVYGSRPVLTLIRSGSHVFGGYTTEQWKSGPNSGDTTAYVPERTPSSSFLFSVTGPFGSNVLFPLRPFWGEPQYQLGCSWQGPLPLWQCGACGNFGEAGPSFGFHAMSKVAELEVRGLSTVPVRLVGSCALGIPVPGVFTDTLGTGPLSFTGTPTFPVDEIEIFGVERTPWYADSVAELRFTPLCASVLSTVPVSCVRQLLAALLVWLPGRTVGPLLYRGTRNGLTPAAFHAACDGKGPTLTLITADAKTYEYSSQGERVTSCVFGGYAGVSWDSSGKYVPCTDAFLFSLQGPHTPALTRFPLKPTGKSFTKALYCDAQWGPCFGRGDLRLGSLNSGIRNCGAAAVPFDWQNSRSRPGDTFVDVLKKGEFTFTGFHRLAVREVEVYSVCPS